MAARINKELSSFFNASKYQKIVGVFLLIFSFILFFSFLSYIFSFRMDQSIALEGWDYIKETDHYKIQNWLNKIGVFLGYFFVDSLFGLAAFIIPISLFLLSLNLIFVKRLFSYLKLAFYPFLFIFILSSFLALVQLVFFRSGYFSLGGNFGNLITGPNSILHNYLGTFGVLLIWFGCSLMALVWFANLNFNFILEWFEHGRLPEEEKLFKEEIVTQKKEDKIYSDTLFEKDNIEVINSEKLIINNEEIIGMESNNESIADQLEIKNTVTVDPMKPIDEMETTVLTIIPKVEEKLVSNVSEIQQKNLENLEPYDPKKDLSSYKYPTIDLLENHGSGTTTIDRNELENNKNQIVETLKNFNISISSIRATVGPTVTLYEITPAPGVRVSTISRLENDIALSLAALGIRIIAPIPGKGTIGIEVPNKKTEIVSMKSAIMSEKFQTTKMELPIALGKNISNEMVVVDLATMPHLLMAGATGKGKSVGINAILVSLLYKKHPSELKFVMVDPKKVELSIYSTIEKHFLAKLPNEEEPIITDVKKVVNTLNSLCIEMDDRYDLLKKATVRNIKEYNDKFKKRQLNPLHGHRYLPYFVLVIDEYADLIITAGKEVEMPLARIAQLARAIGIHVILATQRPAANILTGLIRANFPTKIAFAVSKAIDSNIIIDTKGAEQLIGRGDMLYSPSGGDIIRLQCPFVDTPEVDKICQHIAEQQGYGEAYQLPEYYGDEELDREIKFDKNDIDPLFEEAAREIVIQQIGSISLLQRKLNVGHGRAGRLVDQLEAMGIVGPNKGSKPRDVNFKTLDELQLYLDNLKKSK
ncbi:MAG: DNA translocase FtsK 4TM domain-containing protein [Chitinophagales bacterium]|jgi:S-DNA-T family DNA segregation ATPase FtsK/SpoIIIE|nr:DNA translocase FtsK [Sphingobacteriales bacterium]